MTKWCLHSRAGRRTSRFRFRVRWGAPMDEQLRVTVEPGGVVRVAGEVDMLTADHLAAALNGLVSVTVECSELTSLILRGSESSSSRANARCETAGRSRWSDCVAHP